MSNEVDTLFTPEDLAARWRVATKTILNWCYDGKLPFAMHLGNKWRFHEADVAKHERSRRVGKDTK